MMPADALLTARSLLIGAIGAGLAYLIGLPAPQLIGPALAVSLAGLAGVRAGLANPLREAGFIVLGIGIGAGFDPEAFDAILRWPLAFVALGVALWFSLVTCRIVLARFFGFDRRSAVLAAAPGHLSFVLSLGAEIGGDIPRIAMVQSIRLLALTLLVPLVAVAMGFEISMTEIVAGPPMANSHLAGLFLAALLVGFGFRRLRMPAPMLLGGMAVSALGHVTDTLHGGVPPWLLTPAFVLLGTLIGARFSGISLAQLRASALAGIAVTVIAGTMCALAALPIAATLGVPLPQVLAAFAPGGLETMVALGAALGADPSFTAASHIMRLVILTVLIPLAVPRR